MVEPLKTEELRIVVPKWARIFGECMVDLLAMNESMNTASLERRRLEKLEKRMRECNNE